MEIFSKIIEFRDKNIPFVFCTIIESRGSVPAVSGSKMIVLSDGSSFGTIGGGMVEYEAIKYCSEVLRMKKVARKKYDLTNDLGMACTGIVEVFFEPFFPDAKLYIFGAGHVGKEIAGFASEFDFDITLIDNREKILKDISLKGISVLHGDYNKIIDDVDFSGDSYVVIVSHNREYDEVILKKMLTKELKYLGMMGSKKKVTDIRNRILGEGLISENKLNNVKMPIGFNLNTITPKEIAISVVAEIIDVKNSK